MDDIQKVKEAIDGKHKSSGGSCGIYIPDLAFETQLPYAVLNPILKQLYDEKYFGLRQGLNGKLIFKNIKRT